MVSGAERFASEAELRETGVASRLGFTNAAELRRDYPGFYWRTVRPYLDPAVRYLGVTQEGKEWLARLYANVFAEEHEVACSGPERAAVVSIAAATG